MPALSPNTHASTNLTNQPPFSFLYCSSLQPSRAPCKLSSKHTDGVGAVVKKDDWIVELECWYKRVKVDGEMQLDGAGDTLYEIEIIEWNHTMAIESCIIGIKVNLKDKGDETLSLPTTERNAIVRRNLNRNS